jgi:hypothetical protein
MKRTIHGYSIIGSLFVVGCGVAPETDANENSHESSARSVVALERPANPYSAHREPNTDWKLYGDAANTKVAAATRSVSTQASTRYVYDSRVSVAAADLSKVPVWSDADITMLFRATRDARYMTDSGNFVRRPSWLYPDDGCWIRAELAAIAAAEAGKTKPYKLFSFGNLTVSTPNAPGGSVSWWYHVVPIVKNTSGEAFVLDAAIDATRPLPWKTWLLKQVPTLADVEVTIADSNAFHPYSPVTGATPPTKESAMQDMSYYLDAEWYRQGDLGRDPVTALGYFPPWANVGKDFDGDGRSDLLWHNGSTGEAQVWYMNGSTPINFGSLVNTLSSEWDLVGSGDFDRDGKTDLIWHNGASGEVRVWYMVNATRTASVTVDRRMPGSSGWAFVGADDFDYDGRTDLAWHNGTTGYTQIWYLDNGLKVSRGSNLDPKNLVKDSSGWRFAGTADFNHDGRTDVIWRNGNTGETRVWYLEGMTKKGEGRFSSNLIDSSGWSFFSARDFNYDGRSDIVWHNGSSGETQIWYLDGVTTQGSATLPVYVSDDSGWSRAGY